MESEAAVAVMAEPTGEELIQAVANARMAEAIAMNALQEARTLLGDRQQSWQAAQEQTRREMQRLREHIDREAGNTDRAGTRARRGGQHLRFAGVVRRNVIEHGDTQALTEEIGGLTQVQRASR